MSDETVVTIMKNIMIMWYLTLLVAIGIAVSPLVLAISGILAGMYLGYQLWP